MSQRTQSTLYMMLSFLEYVRKMTDLRMNRAPGDINGTISSCLVLIGGKLHVIEETRSLIGRRYYSWPPLIGPRRYTLLFQKFRVASRLVLHRMNFADTATVTDQIEMYQWASDW